MTNFTKSLAAEWRPRGVSVNEIMAMAVTRPEESRYQDKGNVEHIVSRSMVRSLGTPEDHVGTAIFLCSDASEWVCGPTLVCNGDRL